MNTKVYSHADYSNTGDGTSCTNTATSNCYPLAQATYNNDGPCYAKNQCAQFSNTKPQQVCSYINVGAGDCRTGDVNSFPAHTKV